MSDLFIPFRLLSRYQVRVPLLSLSLWIIFLRRLNIGNVACDCCLSLQLLFRSFVRSFRVFFFVVVFIYRCIFFSRWAFASRRIFCLEYSVLLLCCFIWLCCHLLHSCTVRKTKNRNKKKQRMEGKIEVRALFPYQIWLHITICRSSFNFFIERNFVIRMSHL